MELEALHFREAPRAVIEKKPAAAAEQLTKIVFDGPPAGVELEAAQVLQPLEPRAP